MHALRHVFVGAGNVYGKVLPATHIAKRGPADSAGLFEKLFQKLCRVLRLLARVAENNFFLWFRPKMTGPVWKSFEEQ